jgi:zona occludens toxin (predicted ATPase)
MEPRAKAQTSLWEVIPVPIVLVLIAVVVGSSLVLVWALCAVAGRADALQELASVAMLNRSSPGGARLQDARDRRRKARPGSPERRRHPRLSV